MTQYNFEIEYDASDGRTYRIWESKAFGINITDDSKGLCIGTYIREEIYWWNVQDYLTEYTKQELIDVVKRVLKLTSIL